MTHGPHGDLVDAFLAELRRATPDDWRDFARAATPSEASVDATRAVAGLRLSAATLASVGSAATRTYREVLPSLDDTAGPGRRRSSIAGLIRSASLAVSGHEQLDPTHLAVVLGPFAGIGCATAAQVLRGAGLDPEAGAPAEDAPAG